MDPKLLPEFVHDLAEWTRRSAPTLWCAKSTQGSPFYWPPGIANPVPAAQAAGQKIYDQALRQSRSNALAQTAMYEMQQKTTFDAFTKLANYHATTLEQASLFYIGQDISYLAGRTQMQEYRLDLDMLYLDPANKKSLMTCGFMMWDTPIGTAESNGRLTAQYDSHTGELLEVEVIDDVMQEFRLSDSPVNALSWRILPNAKEVLLTFYTDGSKAREGYEKHIEAERKSLPPGMTIDEDAVRLQLSDPQPLEREQVIPLNRTLGWFEEKDKKERLELTITSDPSYLRIAERDHVAEDFVRANEKVMPMISQMVKTFVATLAIRRMKLAQRETVPAPSPAVKRMRRAGASPERQQSGVQVVRVGAPLKRKTKPSGGSAGGKWKVKTIIGPVIRTRQYVPAHDEYREGVWMIEPYIAGPRDAPWSEKVRVFLLDDSQESAPKNPAAPPAKKQEAVVTELDILWKHRDPMEIVEFIAPNSIADFVVKHLPRFGKGSVEDYESFRTRGESESVFRVNLHVGVLLHEEIGNLFDHIVHDDVSASEVPNPVSLMENLLNTIEEVMQQERKR